MKKEDPYKKMWREREGGLSSVRTGREREEEEEDMEGARREHAKSKPARR